MNFLILLLLLSVVSFAFISSMNGIALGAITAGSNFCNVFPTNPECTGFRHDPVYDNFWFCEYVNLPSMCNNPPDPQKQIPTLDSDYCCRLFDDDLVSPRDVSHLYYDPSYLSMVERGLTLDESYPLNELVIWTDKDHYNFGDRINVYGKFNFGDPVLKNNNSFVDISINNRKVILDLPVQSNGWFAGYFTLSNPYLYYTGSNLISTTYFHTPTQNEPDKFAHASYKITTGNISTEPFSIVDNSLSGRLSYEIVSESDNPVNLDLAIVRLEAPNGLVLPLPSISFVEDISDYLDESLVLGKYEITVTKGNYTSSQTFEDVEYPSSHN